MALLAGAAHEQKTHARMLKERPTAASGEPLEVLDALQLVQGGQMVNCAIGLDVAARPALLHDVSSRATRIAAELGRALGVPTELLMDGKQGIEIETSAAEVLTVNIERQEVVLGLDTPPIGAEPGFPALVDLTDATGTYYLAGTAESVHVDGYPRVTLRIRQASHVQLRRFVRVPVLISPYVMDVQQGPGLWRAVRGQVVDMSLGGVGILVDEPLLDESRIRMELELPGRFGDLAITGRVVPPPGPAEAQTGQRRGVGLAHRRGVIFDPLSIDDLRRLQRALYRRQVELRRLAEPRPLRSQSSRSGAADGAVPRPRWKLWGWR